MPNLKSYLYGAVGIAIILGLSWVYFLKESRDKYQAKAVYEQAEKDKAIAMIKQLQESAASDQKLLEGYQSVKTEIQYVDRDVVKQVIKYRDVVTTRYIIDPKFVQIYNESTESVHTENSTTGINDTGPSLAKIVNDADLLDVVTSNNRICVKQAAQLTALQKWAASN